MAKSKLLSALDRYKGVDHKLAHQKKLQKKAEKRKRTKAKEVPYDVEFEEKGEEEDAQMGDNGVVQEGNEDPEADGTGVEDEADAGVRVDNGEEVDEETWETDRDAEDDDEAAEGAQMDTSRLDDSDTSSEDDADDDGVDGSPNAEANNEDEEDDIPLSDLDSLASEEKGDILPHQRLTINNIPALHKAHKSIALPLSRLPFSAHQSLTTAAPISIPDIDDDLNRELAFYSQSLSAVKEARALLKAEGVPFARPADYFAEMVKSDEHMGRVKQRLVDEAAGKRAAAEARKQRDLKKFGKQVQVARLQERERAKRDTLERINVLKRKRQGADIGNADEDDLFDVALEDAAAADRADKAARRRAQSGGRSATGKPNVKRQKRDEKYGFGGKKRFAKSGDAISSADMRGFSAKKMKGQKKGPQRLGKSRRAKRV